MPPSNSSSSPRLPKYRHHRASGQAVVTIGGKDRYLGPWRSKASRLEYDRLIAEWLAAGRPTRSSADLATPLTVAELLVRYWVYAKIYYRQPDGTESSELHNLRLALRPVKRLYSKTLAADFGPLSLQTVRQEMIDRGLTRVSINRNVGRVKRLFKWAVANELVPPSVFHGLQAVAGLRAGRTEAVESEPVKPVSQAFVDAVLPYLSEPVRAMVELQLYTAARPGEILAMRGCDLDTTGKIWLYCPPQHKNAYRGHQRTIYLGPRAQTIVKRFLKTDLEAPLFSPRDAKETYWKRQRAGRKTPMTPSQAKRTRKRKPKRPPGDRYSLQSYSRAIAKACQKADVPHWHPHQLRHSSATRLRKEFGLDMARCILGHRSPAVTEVYAQIDHAKAMEVVEKIG